MMVDMIVDKNMEKWFAYQLVNSMKIFKRMTGSTEMSTPGILPVVISFDPVNIPSTMPESEQSFNSARKLVIEIIHQVLSSSENIDIYNTQKVREVLREKLDNYYSNTYRQQKQV